MPPNPRVAKAFRAMKDLGIKEEKVKPVLKKLLKLYEKNWELIEEENYRALADAIFDSEDTEKTTQNKGNQDSVKDLDEEAQLQEELERPLKRLRLRHKDTEASTSSFNPDSNSSRLKKPKIEDAGLHDRCMHHQSFEEGASKSPDVGNAGLEPDCVLSSTLIRNKGKEPVTSDPVAVQKGFHPSQPVGMNRNEYAAVLRPLVIRDRENESISSQFGSINSKESVAVFSLPSISDGGKEPTSSLSDGMNRNEPSLVSSPVTVRRRGKERVSPQIGTKGNLSFSEQQPHVVSVKELQVESSIVPFTKQKCTTLSLIKPKDEPFTDDILQLEVPLSVIHLDSLQLIDSSAGHSSVTVREKDVPKVLASHCVIGGDKSVKIPASPSERRNSSDLAEVPNGSTSNLDIASSLSGEVKISFNFDSSFERPGFHTPSLDAVIKMVEDRCLTSYKLMDPNFSVMKLMKDMCDCFLERGTDSVDKSQHTIDVTPAINLLKKTNTGVYDCLNGQNFPCDNEVTLPQTPGLPAPCNGSYFNNVESNSEDNEENEIEKTNSLSLVLVHQPELNTIDIGALHDVSDLDKGQEELAVSLVNGVTTECPPSFRYIPLNVVFQNAFVNFTLAHVKDDYCCSTCVGNCLLLPTPCACAHETGGEFAYTLEGTLKEDFLESCILMSREPPKHCLYFCSECPLERFKNEEKLEPCKGHLKRKFIKECWYKCGCNKQCGNRVVQRGVSCRLQVFMTREGKGWGLRTLEDLPKGAFVCEYVGEVLTSKELYDRIFQNSRLCQHSYSILLDADWGSEGVLKDEEALCLDATYFGNVARFINHRCGDSNLVEIPVEVETSDRHYYRHAFFTTRTIEAMEELTWDYGIDFDDQGYPIKAFPCRCGSKFCRNMRRSRTGQDPLLLLGENVRSSEL